MYACYVCSICLWFFVFSRARVSCGIRKNPWKFIVNLRLYRFSSKPQYLNVLVRYFCNNKGACRVPYSTFFSLIWITVIPFSYMKCFSYLFGSTCASSMTSGPVSRTHIVSSMSAYMNATGMSYVATYLFSLAFMTQDSNMDSVLTLGEIVSYFILYTLCFLQWAYPRPLVFLHCF